MTTILKIITNQIIEIKVTKDVNVAKTRCAWDLGLVAFAARANPSFEFPLNFL